eukprot:jgi/Botrbrau1/20198/Bobra.0761s0001.1
MLRERHNCILCPWVSGDVEQFEGFPGKFCKSIRILLFSVIDNIDALRVCRGTHIFRLCYLMITARTGVVQFGSLRERLREFAKASNDRHVYMHRRVRIFFGIYVSLASMV